MEIRQEIKVAVLMAVVISLAIVGLWGTLRLLSPSNALGGEISVSMTIEADGWSITYEAVTSNRTVLALLLEAGDRLGFEVRWTYWESLGAAKVDAINGIRDGHDGLYWQYWVNGEYGQVGADRYILTNGDNVLWRHTTFPPEG